MLVTAANAGLLTGLTASELTLERLTHEQRAVVRSTYSEAQGIHELVAGFRRQGVRLPETPSETIAAVKMAARSCLPRPRMNTPLHLSTAQYFGVPIKIFGFPHGLGGTASGEYAAEAYRYAAAHANPGTVFLTEEDFRKFLRRGNLAEIETTRGFRALTQEFLDRFMAEYRESVAIDPELQAALDEAKTAERDDGKSIFSDQNIMNPSCWDGADDVHMNRYSMEEYCHLAAQAFWDCLKLYPEGITPTTKDQLFFAMGTWRSALMAAGTMYTAALIAAGGIVARTDIVFICGQQHEADMKYFLDHPSHLLEALSAFLPLAEEARRIFDPKSESASTIFRILDYYLYWMNMPDYREAGVRLHDCRHPVEPKFAPSHVEKVLNDLIGQ